MICLRSKRSCLFWNEVKEKAKEKHKTHVNFNDTFDQDSNSSKKYSPSGSVVGGILPTKLPTEVAQLLLILCSLLQISLVRRWQRPSKRTQAALLRALPSLLGLQANTAESYYPPMYTAPCRCKTVQLSSLLGTTYVILPTN